jgi:hypothetical protein
MNICMGNQDNSGHWVTGPTSGFMVMNARIEATSSLLLDFLVKTGGSATFFILGDDVRCLSRDFHLASLGEVHNLWITSHPIGSKGGFSA